MPQQTPSGVPSTVAELIGALSPLDQGLPVLMDAGWEDVHLNLAAFTACVHITVEPVIVDPQIGYFLPAVSPLPPGTGVLTDCLTLTAVGDTSDPKWRQMPPQTVGEILSILSGVDPALPVIPVIDPVGGGAWTCTTDLDIELLYSIVRGAHWLVAADGVPVYAGMSPALTLTPKEP